MKLSNRLVLAMAIILVAFGSNFAQRGEDRPSAEDMAKRQTERLTESLELTNEQAEKVAAINLKYAKQVHEKREAMRQQEEKGREARKAEREKVRTAHNAELKVVLTELQYAKLEGLQEARQERPHRRGSRKGKGKNREDRG
ncbi:MAG: hypothetical protein AAGG68_27145 [Bacteroidota bacterium]